METESITMPSRRGAAVFLLFLTCFTMFLLIGRSLAAEAERAPLAPASTRVQQDESVKIAYIVRRSSADHRRIVRTHRHAIFSREGAVRIREIYRSPR